MAKKIDLDGLEFYKGKENAMIAGEYSSSKTYKLDEHCYYQGVLKTCIVPITTPEAFTAAHWKNTVIADELTSQSGKIAQHDTRSEVRFNIWDETWENGTIDDTTGANSSNNNMWRSKGFVPVMPETQYYVKGVFARIFYYNSSKTFLSKENNVGNKTFTTPANCRYIRFRSAAGSGTVSYGYDCCVNLSQPDTSIEPYNGQYVSSNAYNYVGVDLLKLKATVNNKVTKGANVVVVGNKSWCDYSNMQDALLAITDDSATNPYIIHVCQGTYPTFSMRFDDRSDREHYRTTARWISIEGENPYNTIFIDNKGNRNLSPCEIFTNGIIKNITFSVQADSDHYDPTNDQTSCYAVHQDFNTCNTQYINCRFLSNVGPGYGAGLFKDSVYELINCYFESSCDGSFGEKAQTGQGAIFVHTYSSLFKALNQKLHIVDSIAVATAQDNGGRFAVIGSTHELYESTYSFEFQNFGCFGQNGSQVSLVDPDTDLLGAYNFNNLPASLNTAT